MPVFRQRRAALGLALALLASACSTDPVSPPDTTQPSFALTAVAGGGQVGRADRPLASPLQVAVTRDGAPAAGVHVVWYTADGLIEPSGVTDAQGIATAVWTLPRRTGHARTTAHLEGSGAVPVTFVAEARVPQLRRVSGDNQVGTVGEALPEPLSVQVLWDGEPLAGEAVVYSFHPTPVLTGPDGIATSSWRVGRSAGQHFAFARIDRLENPAVRFGATAEAGPPALLEMHPTSQANPYWIHGSPAHFSLTAKDAYGNVIPGMPIAWSLASGTGTWVGTTTNQYGNAYVDVTASADYEGDLRVQAAAGAIQSVSEASRFTHFMFVDPTGWGDEAGPSSVTVASGTRVRWVHLGFWEHVIGPKGGIVSTRLSEYGAVAELSFTTPGVHEWICTLHDWEKFTITVEP